MYKFNGSENAKRIVKDTDYKGISTPCDLYDFLTNVWCKETCAPRLQDKWSINNKTLGQCSITAFLVQDIFGGKVYAVKTANGIHLSHRAGCLDFNDSKSGRNARLNGVFFQSIFSPKCML